ncbi:MAG TPA: MmcQ/YjbR family DNA-binding protein [Lacunisphaera sp.]|nr:MmcQ/YjbR family DNA-binding protein [Lacunisphaera sp.]
MQKEKIDFNMVRELALGLPGIEPGTIHGAPSLKLRGKLFCCPALHGSAEANSLVIRMDRAERTKLLKAQPSVYYVTDHYRDHSTVLVRLAHIDRDSLRDLLRNAWKFAAASKATRRA